MSLGTRASEAASTDGVWAYWRNFSVAALGRGHVIRNVQIALMHLLIQVLDLYAQLLRFPQWKLDIITVHDKLTRLPLTAFPLRPSLTFCYHGGAVTSTCIRPWINKTQYKIRQDKRYWHNNDLLGEHMLSELIYGP